mmetsp:Transcript_7621/g.6987  ORF Transcript_7621/g.6987 Transcript_7621/m.6987 type:complete len:200 (-) Transcript_7621:1482-2081(-)
MEGAVSSRESLRKQLHTIIADSLRLSSLLLLGHVLFLDGLGEGKVLLEQFGSEDLSLLALLLVFWLLLILLPPSSLVLIILVPSESMALAERSLDCPPPILLLVEDGVSALFGRLLQVWTTVIVEPWLDLESLLLDHMGLLPQLLLLHPLALDAQDLHILLLNLLLELLLLFNLEVGLPLLDSLQIFGHRLPQLLLFKG